MLILGINGKSFLKMYRFGEVSVETVDELAEMTMGAVNFPLFK